MRRVRRKGRAAAAWENVKGIRTHYDVLFRKGQRQPFVSHKRGRRVCGVPPVRHPEQFTGAPALIVRTAWYERPGSPLRYQSRRFVRWRIQVGTKLGTV